MPRRPLSLLAASAAPLCLALAAGCAAPEAVTDASPYAQAPDPTAGPPADAVRTRPWTDAFLAPAVLIAEEVHLEGPPGLLDHVATRIDPEVHDQEVRTVPDGLRQTFSLRAPASPEQAAAWAREAPPAPRAWLDGLEVVALRRLVVLERPGGDRVRVVATGDAFYRPAGQRAGEGEQRGPRLEFEGRVRAEDVAAPAR